MPGGGERVLGMDRAEDGRAEDRAGGHPEERQRADDPERPGPRGAVVQVRGGGRPDRDEHAAADGLDEAGGDELVQVLGGPGQRRPDDEHDQRAEEQPAGAPRSASRPARGMTRMYTSR